MEVESLVVSVKCPIQNNLTLETEATSSCCRKVDFKHTRFIAWLSGLCTIYNPQIHTRIRHIWWTPMCFHTFLEESSTQVSFPVAPDAFAVLAMNSHGISAFCAPQAQTVLVMEIKYISNTGFMQTNYDGSQLKITEHYKAKNSFWRRKIRKMRGAEDKQKGRW